MKYLSALNGAHYTAIGMLMTAMGAHFSEVESWKELTSPMGLGSLLLTIGAFATALGSKKVELPKEN